MSLFIISNLDNSSNACDTPCDVLALVSKKSIPHSFANYYASLYEIYRLHIKYYIYSDSKSPLLPTKSINNFGFPFYFTSSIHLATFS